MIALRPLLTAFAVAVSIGCLPAHAPAAAAGAEALVPHRAVYDLTLDRPSAKSTVQAASGRIVYEFAGSACDGFTMSLRQVVQIDGEDGRDMVSDTRATSWEDQAARTFRFASQSTIDRVPQEASEGRAEKADDGTVVVDIVKPAAEQVRLGAGVAFPTEHMRRLIEIGARGENLLSIKMFDGIEAGRKVYDTLGVVGRAIPPEATAGLEPAVQRPELRGVRRWPVTVSYFDAGSDAQTPNYTMGFELYENGISRALVLDYGDFRLKGELTTLDFLTPTPCRD